MFDHSYGLIDEFIFLFVDFHDFLHESEHVEYDSVGSEDGVGMDCRECAEDRDYDPEDCLSRLHFVSP